MAILQVNFLSKSLFRTVPMNVILPADKLTGKMENMTFRSLKRRWMFFLKTDSVISIPLRFTAGDRTAGKSNGYVLQNTIKHTFQFRTIFGVTVGDD